jgi:hypothetical protein
MSSILYYSNYCEKSKEILNTLAKSPSKDSIHYLCIDRREKDSSGNTYLLLEKGQRVILPPSVNKVPALLLLNEGHRVLFGGDILKQLNPREIEYNKKTVNQQTEPSPFAFGGESNYGVSSDSFSFWDQSSDDLLAEGNGGMRQMYNYTGLDQNMKIETPPDTYSPDKIGNVSLEQLQQQRNKDINK